MGKSGGIHALCCVRRNTLTTASLTSKRSTNLPTTHSRRTSLKEHGRTEKEGRSVMGLTDLPEPAAATAARGAQPQGSRPPPSPLAEVDPGEPAAAQLIRHHGARPHGPSAATSSPRRASPAAGASRSASPPPVFRAARAGGRSSPDRIRI